MRPLLLVLFAIASVGGAGCGVEVRTYARDNGITIHHLVVGVGNVWAIEDSENGGLLVVDLAEKGDADEIERGLEQLGYALDDVDLTVITHGHMDHGGPVAALQEAGLGPIALGEGDVEIVESGVSIPGPSLIWEGEIVRGIVDTTFPEWTPDIALGDDEVPLREQFGVAGRIVPMPGHTAGSVCVVLESGDAFVGDLIRGGGSEDGEHEGEAVTHFFSDDEKADRHHLDDLLGFGVDTFFPGHGPYFSSDSLRGWLADRQFELGERER